MTLMEQIQKQIRQLPPESQREVLDFVTFLQLRPLISPTLWNGRDSSVKTGRFQGVPHDPRR
jgi:hypothetical protein